MMMRISQKKAEPVIHRGGWVVADPQTVLESGYVRIEAGIIKEIGQGRCEGSGRIIDHGPGVLIPALVNVHTHLELSAFKGKLAFDNGFKNWVRQLITLRDAASRDALLAGAQNGISELLSSGSRVVGEISTLGLTRNAFLQSELAGVWFQERLGTVEPDGGAVNPPSAPSNDRKLLSVAGHAPHTTSPDLLVSLKQATRRRHLPLSIHLAESEDESEFLETGRGAWAQFLTERGIDFSKWGLPVASPVKYMEQLGLLDPETIAVHLVSADREDFEILRESGTRVCLCLRSNTNLHQRLPDVKSMIESGIQPCLGTDSLASTGSLSIFDEMAFGIHHFPWLAPEQILAMATINGAKALGFEKMFGSLAPGKIGSLVYVPVEASSASAVLEKLVSADFVGPCSCI